MSCPAPHHPMGNQTKENVMKKLSIFVVGGAVVPAAAFAIHVSNCCGNFICCLRHLGCC